jgi:hypothetical protein
LSKNKKFKVNFIKKNGSEKIKKKKYIIAKNRNTLLYLVKKNEKKLFNNINNNNKDINMNTLDTSLTIINYLNVLDSKYLNLLKSKYKMTLSFYTNVTNKDAYTKYLNKRNDSIFDG